MKTTLNDFLLLEANASYGCLMLDLEGAFANEEQFGEGASWRSFAPAVAEEDLYYNDEDPNPSGYGFEDDPHVTVKYGLHDDAEPEDVLDTALGALESARPIKVTLTALSLFENEKFDVLKYDVESEDLRAMNAVVSDSFENSDSYPTYHPHVTVAYLKKGEGKKYVADIEPVEIASSILEYSDANKNKTIRKIDSEIDGTAL